MSLSNYLAQAGIYTGDVPVPTGERSVEERRLHALGNEPLLVDLTSSFFEAGQPYSFGTEPFPDPISQLDRVLSDHFSALIYLDRADAMRSLLW